MGARAITRTDPCHWSRAWLRLGSNCDSVDNSIYESFNKWIVEARFFAIITMQETIRRKIMVRIQENNDKWPKWTGTVCPNIMKKLEKMINELAHCAAISNGNNCFEVTQRMQYRFKVDLTNWTCSCRYWQLSSLPCAHVVCVIHMANPLSLSLLTFSAMLLAGTQWKISRPPTQTFYSQWMEWQHGQNQPNLGQLLLVMSRCQGGLGLKGKKERERNHLHQRTEWAKLAQLVRVLFANLQDITRQHAQHLNHLQLVNMFLENQIQRQVKRLVFTVLVFTCLSMYITGEHNLIYRQFIWL